MAAHHGTTEIQMGEDSMTPLELALLIVGTFMLFGVLGWIAVCLIRARND